MKTTAQVLLTVHVASLWVASPSAKTSESNGTINSSDVSAVKVATGGWNLTNSL